MFNFCNIAIIIPAYPFCVLIETGLLNFFSIFQILPTIFHLPFLLYLQPARLREQCQLCKVIDTLDKPYKQPKIKILVPTFPSNNVGSEPYLYSLKYNLPEITTVLNNFYTSLT